MPRINSPHQPASATEVPPLVLSALAASPASAPQHALDLPLLAWKFPAPVLRTHCEWRHGQVTQLVTQRLLKRQQSGEERKNVERVLRLIRSLSGYLWSTTLPGTVLGAGNPAVSLEPLHFNDVRQTVSKIKKHTLWYIRKWWNVMRKRMRKVE